jgi:hypothetical protein
MRFVDFGEQFQHIIKGDVWSRSALPIAKKNLAAVAVRVAKTFLRGRLLWDGKTYWGRAAMALGARARPRSQISVDFLARRNMTCRKLKANAAYALIATMPSISTEIWLGSMTLPTAERAWRPASPKTSTNRSEQPLMTFGESLKSGVALTMPKSLTT